MTFLTAQQYENYSYRFYLEDDGTYIIKVFLEDKRKAIRNHKTKEEVIERYGKYFPELKDKLTQ